MSPPSLSVWIPSLAGGLAGLFVGDLVSSMHPTDKSWQIVSKVTGLMVGVTVGAMLTPSQNPTVPAYAGVIATF
jgi:hypothetical protein